MKKKSSPNTIIDNRRARFEYTLEDSFEAGICLEGWEVKSLRSGRVQINESHIILKKGEAWLIGAIITPLVTASTHITPDPTRTRKLLLKKKELAKFIGQVERKGYSLIPLSLYWKKNIVKLKFALAKGKKAHDKRATIKERDWKRQKERISKLT